MPPPWHSLQVLAEWIAKSPQHVLQSKSKTSHVPLPLLVGRQCCSRTTAATADAAHAAHATRPLERQPFLAWKWIDDLEVD